MPGHRQMPSCDRDLIPILRGDKFVISPTDFIDHYILPRLLGPIYAFLISSIGNAVVDLIFSIANREVTFFSGNAAIRRL